MLVVKDFCTDYLCLNYNGPYNASVQDDWICAFFLFFFLLFFACLVLCCLVVRVFFVFVFVLFVVHSYPLLVCSF